MEELLTYLSRERAQTMPEYTFTLSVISGTSVLALTGFSDSAAGTRVTLDTSTHGGATAISDGVQAIATSFAAYVAHYGITEE